MKPDMIEWLKRNFEKSEDRIYLAGPFFGELQESFAQLLAAELKMRGYLVYAPVEEKFKEGTDLTSVDIFERNLRWLDDCTFVLAQLDYPLMELNILAIVDQERWQYTQVRLPDAGTVWEMGYAYAKKKPIIGFTYEVTAVINLMLAEGLAGYFQENPLEVFRFKGIHWPLITGWKGKKL